MAWIALTHDAAAAADTHPMNASTWRALVNKTTARLRAIEPYGQSAVLLALRLLYGGLFARAGWGKLMNFERTRGFFEGLGLPAPGFMVALVATTELIGGVLLVLGAGTRVASAALTVVMVTAFATAHAAEAFESLSAFTQQAPYPFLVATLVLLAFGAGRLSIDGWRHARTARRERGAAPKASD